MFHTYFKHKNKFLMPLLILNKMSRNCCINTSFTNPYLKITHRKKRKIIVELMTFVFLIPYALTLLKANFLF